MKGLQPGDGFKQGAFTGAIRAKDRDEFAGSNAQGTSLSRGLLAMDKLKLVTSSPLI